MTPSETVERLRADSAEYDNLAKEVLLLGYRHGWSLFDVGEDAAGDKVVAQIGAIARRYDYATAPPKLILPLARYERLLSRRFGDLGNDARRAEHDTQARFLAKRVGAPPEDQFDLERIRVLTLRETAEMGETGVRLRAHGCELAEQLYLQNPQNRERIVAKMDCQTLAAREAQGKSDETRSDKLMTDAQTILEEALAREPLSSQLLLTKANCCLRDLKSHNFEKKKTN